VNVISAIYRPYVLCARPARFFSIAVLCLVGACASGETWHRPGADAATTERDVDACRREAMRAEVATGIALDEPLGSGPQSLPRVTEPGGYPDGGGLSDADAHAILRQCLEGRGYLPGDP